MNNLVSYLDGLISEKDGDIKNWLNNKYTRAPALYSSVDIRYSGNKIAPVDTNLFPAGFNNLSSESRKIATKLAYSYIKNQDEDIHKILLIPESHTRNLGYLENIKTLYRIFLNAGFEVKIGALQSELQDFVLDETQEIIYSSIIRDSDRIVTHDGYVADCIIMNNDMTAGRPEILEDIKQPILTPLNMGWYQRQKITNLRSYDAVITEFAQEFKIPNALISTEYGFCQNINFKEKKGLDCVANEVEKVLFKIRNNYQALGIKDKPYVYIKANRGTYGMGIMTADSGDQIYEINKKERNKMAVIKNNTQNAEIIVQEGVKTSLTFEHKPCEAFTYQIGGQTAGTIYRINQTKNEYSNLNSSGVEFTAMNKTSLGNFYDYYDMIASLSTLAATNEHDYDF